MPRKPTGSLFNETIGDLPNRTLLASDTVLMKAFQRESERDRHRDPETETQRQQEREGGRKKGEDGVGVLSGAGEPISDRQVGIHSQDAHWWGWRGSTRGLTWGAGEAGGRAVGGVAGVGPGACRVCLDRHMAGQRAVCGPHDRTESRMHRAN